MCFTLLGRLETRLLSLGWPLALALAQAALWNDADYLRLLNLMALASLKSPKKDMEKTIVYWEAGLQGAHDLQSRQRLIRVRD